MQIINMVQIVYFKNILTILTIKKPWQPPQLFKELLFRYILDQLLPDGTRDPVDDHNHNDDPQKDDPDPAPLPVVQGDDQRITDTTGTNQTQNGCGPDGHVKTVKGVGNDGWHQVRQGCKNSNVELRPADRRNRFSWTIIQTFNRF